MKSDNKIRVRPEQYLERFPFSTMILWVKRKTFLESRRFGHSSFCCFATCISLFAYFVLSWRDCISEALSMSLAKLKLDILVSNYFSNWNLFVPHLLFICMLKLEMNSPFYMYLLRVSCWLIICLASQWFEYSMRRKGLHSCWVVKWQRIETKRTCLF